MRKQFYILGRLAVVALLTLAAQAQTVRYGSLTGYVDSCLATLPGEGAADLDKYQVPSDGQLSFWAQAVSDILNADYASAQTQSAVIGYQLIRFTDTDVTPAVTYYILEKHKDSTHYWGTFVYNPQPKRGRLFIQSPHPLHDTYTGRQGIVMFKLTGARAWFMTGTHRCNSTSYSSCDGTTTACTETSENYRASDQPHMVTGMLQRTTQILGTVFSGLVVVQNHGFAKGSEDPDVIMGNGKSTAPTGTDYLVRVRDSLAVIDTSLTFKVAHVDAGWTRLTGTDNTQGRLINGSGEPCGTAPSTANGRFLHIEQAYDKLRNSTVNRAKLATAVARAIAADALVLTSPNGGERWTAGTVHAVTWTSAGTVDNVRLDYSLDNGNTWTTIVSSTSNDGSYDWTVPAAGSWHARVRVLDAANDLIGDTSSAGWILDGTVWPTTGTGTAPAIASAFGPRLLSGTYDFHRGIDMPDAANTPIRPAKPGVVVRFETAAQTLGTARERYGNWILVRHDSAGGVPVHTSYLHCASFNGFQVGDTVCTADTIAFMGSSGVGINTVHCHMQYFKNLTGTAIDEDKALNPLGLLPYIDGNAYTASMATGADSSSVFVELPETELDLDGVTFYGSGGTRTVSFNARTGLNPDNDIPTYDGVTIAPESFTIDSTALRIRFWCLNSVLGSFDSARIVDIKGYVRTLRGTTGRRYAVATGSWNGSIWALTTGGAAGSASVPTAANDVTIKTGVTVTVNSTDAECDSLSFESTTAKLAMASGGRLSLYGNFTLASTTHAAFSSWAAGAKIRFCGNAVQTLYGLGDFNATNTSFKEAQVNKTGGIVQTPGSAAGNGYCVTFGDSLEIINGTFSLGARDDFQGRALDGSAATTVLTVRPGGTFTMYSSGSLSHLRSGNASGSSNPIGKLTVQGKAIIATTSSNGVNFGGVDVQSGGALTLNSFSASQPNNFKPGTMTISAGGVVTVNSIVDFWNASSVVTLQSGGTYRVTASTTVLPPTFTNNGTVQYARTASDGSQTIADIAYSSLSIASAGTKTWTLASARTISDSLVMSAGASLVLTSSSPLTVTVGSVLRADSGTITTNTNTLQIGTSASAAGTVAAGAGCVIGTMKRWFAPAVTNGAAFPLSTGTLDRRTVISFTSAPAAGGTVTALYTSSAPGTSGIPLDDNGTTITNVTSDGFWTLTAGDGLSGGTYSLDLNSPGIIGIANVQSLRLLKRASGGAWTAAGTHVNGTGTASAPVVHRTGLTGFSEFAVGAPVENPLPVQFVSVSAVAQRSTVAISWVTAEEVSASSYAVERRELSPAGGWLVVGTHAASGTSFAQHDYEYRDFGVPPGRYAYRIRQIDSNAAARISGETEVQVDEAPRVLRLEANFPNPFNSTTRVEFTVPHDGAARIDVYNTAGEKVGTAWSGIAVAGRYYSAAYQAAGLSSGMYIMTLRQDGAQNSRKILYVK